MYDRYVSPLSERYASKEMQYIFSPDMKFRTWRKLWIALAETEKELGLSQNGKPVITDEHRSTQNHNLTGSHTGIHPRKRRDYTPGSVPKWLSARLSTQSHVLLFALFIPLLIRTFLLLILFLPLLPYLLERLVADCHADKLLHRLREVFISLLVQINVTDRQLFIHLVKAQRHFIWKIDDQAIRDEGRAHAPSCHVERRDNLVRFHDNIRRIILAAAHLHAALVNTVFLFDEDKRSTL